MRLRWKILGLLCFLALAGWMIATDPTGTAGDGPGAGAPAAPAAGALPGGDAGWRRAAPWDDGLAEFCAYEVDWARYSAVYPGRALLVLVKEPWAPDLDVKADRPRPDGFDVLKLNHIRDVPTGIYTYHQMASVYFRRDDARLVKVAATSSEACGVSTASVVRGRLETRSYFDGQGDREQAWPAGALAEDGLPALLRDYVAGAASPPAELTVFPSLMFGRFAALEPASWRLTRRAAGEVEVPAGRFAAVELSLENRAGRRSYTFEAAAPHRLLAYAADDGTRYRLAKCERLAYWNLHDPGGDAWLPERVR